MINDELKRLTARHPVESPPPDLGREKRQQVWKEHVKHWTPQVSEGIPERLTKPYWESHE